MSQVKSLLHDPDAFGDVDIDRVEDLDEKLGTNFNRKITAITPGVDLGEDDLFGSDNGADELTVPGDENLAANNAWDEVRALGEAESKKLAEKSLDEWIQFFDRDHFVSFHGQHFVVYRETYIDGRGALQRINDTSFKKFHANKYVTLTKPDGGLKAESVAKLWLESTKRRFQQLVFDPSGKHSPENYNIWRGFGVDPVPFDPERIKLILDDLILKILCDGDKVAADYLLNWLAHGVQNPAIKPGVAVVLRGLQGTGKGTLGRVMLLIWGAHGITVSHSKHLTGNFNDHLRNTVFVFSDEAQFVGDAQGNQTLKVMVTEDFGMFESKGVDADLRKNYIRVLMATNSDWVVNVGPDSRRYFVLDVSDSRRVDPANPTNRAFWDELNSYINGSGAAEFLDFLLKRDLTGFVPAVFPQTRALANQRALSLGPIHDYLVHLVSDGSIDNREWSSDGVTVTTSNLYESLLEHCKLRGRRAQGLTLQLLGAELAKFGVEKKREGRRQFGTKRGYQYEFPPRAEFAEGLWKALGLPQETLVEALGPQDVPDEA